MVRPAQLEMHDVQVVLQGDEVEAASVLAIAKDAMDRLVVQPFVDGGKPGALPCEPRPPRVRPFLRQHGGE